LGKTKNEDSDDPSPVIVPGEDKPVPSGKIEEYVNSELFHYWRFYSSTRHAGPPFAGGWTQWPPWAAQILIHFDYAVDCVKAHKEREAYRLA